jgi:hypothetical protein
MTLIETIYRPNRQLDPMIGASIDTECLSCSLTVLCAVCSPLTPAVPAAPVKRLSAKPDL